MIFETIKSKVGKLTGLDHPRPKNDPVYGKNGPLLRLWSRWQN